MQAVSLLPVDHYLTDYGVRLARRVAEGNGVLGAVTRVSGQGHGAPGSRMLEALQVLFRLAGEFNLDVDLHVDESGDPAARSLDLVAQSIQTMGYRGTVVCGHCCSLAVRSAKEVDEALELYRSTGIAVVSLPHCNLYLQDRGSRRTPRWRGITLLHELRDARIPIAFGTDNCRDYFYAYGDQDMLAVFAQAALIGHLDRPVSDWISCVNVVPASLMKLPDHGKLRVGGPANFVMFSARQYSELLARPQSDRIVFRSGQIIDPKLPNFAELDE